MSRFEGKVALVTGAGDGLGRATAKKFGAEGAMVIVNDLHDGAAQAVVDDIRAKGGEAETSIFDVTNKQAAKDAVERIVKSQGAIDVLVNNAGFGALFESAETYPSWDAMVALNFSAPFWMSQFVANASMIPGNGGAIVNLSSLAGLAAMANDTGYTATKHGIVGLTKGLAVEWAKYNIRVNAISPGFTKTGTTDRWARNDPEAWQARLDRVPFGREGRPEEQAAAILFLASDDASFITGVTIPVDGGQMALNSGHTIFKR